MPLVPHVLGPSEGLRRGTRRAGSQGADAAFGGEKPGPGRPVPRAWLLSESGPEAGARRAEPVRGYLRAGAHQNNHLGLIGGRRRRQEGGRGDHVTEPPSP